MLQRFKSHLQKIQLPNDAMVLAAVSGGVDSMVMLHLLMKSNIKVAVLHCNFHLRGTESNTDQSFVTHTATSLGLQYYIKNFTPDDFNSQPGSVQMVARSLRYTWFEAMRLKLNATVYATAHHQTDVVETIILNQIRGTGLAGMHGILQQQNCIRPMLFCNNTEIVTYAKSAGIKWREDSSNQTDAYVRNKIRHKILPVLKSINPSVESTFVCNAEKLHQSELLIESFLPQLKAQFLTTNDGIKMPIAPVLQHKAGKGLLHLLLRDFDFNDTDLQSLWHAMHGQTGKQVISKTHVALVNRSQVCIKPLQQKVFKSFDIYSSAPIKQSTFEIAFEVIDKNVFSQLQHNDAYTAYFDAEKIAFPVHCRSWQTGDYFMPLGMKTKKKLSDFFIDQKVSSLEKGNVPLLEINNQIAWVVGYRIDERFKVQNDSKKILRVTWQNI